jgi:protein-S-isoprenylcysteine O-methyltransferase Ste14
MALIYMSAFVLFFGWVALRVRPFDRNFPSLLPQKSDIAGIVVGALAVILVLACAKVFVVRGRGTPAVFDPPREFVAVGPYKYVRNPMYIGGVALLIGFGLYLYSISILTLAVFLFFALHLFVVFYEEPTLSRKFGSSYEEYCKTVSRWIPRMPRARREI